MFKNLNKEELLNISFKKGGFSEFGADCFGIIILALRKIGINSKYNQKFIENLKMIEKEYENFSNITNLKIYKEQILGLIKKIAVPVPDLKKADFIFISNRKMPVHFALIISDELILETNESIGRSFINFISTIPKESVFFRFNYDLF